MGDREAFSVCARSPRGTMRLYEYVGPPLTRDSFASLLDRLGVRPAAYSLYGAHSPDANVIDHRREGWVVFPTERGDESSLVICTTQSDACLEPLDRVTSEDHNFFELVSGPLCPTWQTPSSKPGPTIARSVVIG